MECALDSNGNQELLCRDTPLCSPEGRKVGAVLVLNDVTDLIQVQKNAAWREVARRLAHEIKNPLTPIQLSAEHLQHKLSGELPPKSLEILQWSMQTIVQQVEAMKEMVADFSEYAQSSRKQAKNIDLPGLVQEFIALYALQKDVAFKIAFAESSMRINGDKISIRQVLHNLIKNAMEATSKGGKIEISLSKIFRNNSDFIEVAFYDNGPGIYEAQIDKIFEPYVTTKPKGMNRLGISVCQKIIEEHGGMVWYGTIPYWYNSAKKVTLDVHCHS